MSKLLETEKFMRLHSKDTGTVYAEAFDSLLKVYRFIDEKNYTNHCEIINLLYCKRKRFTLDGLANEIGVSDKALRRYRRDYTGWYKYFLGLLQNEGKAC